MLCRSCGTDLPEDARFCSRCGRGVDLDAVLGVGTNLPQAPVAAPQTSERRGRDGTFSPGRIAAMVSTFVVLTILGTFALSQIFGSGSTEPPVSSASTDAGQGTTSPSPDSSPETSPRPSAPESSAAASSASPSASLPDGARRCSRSGNDPVAAAYSGNSDTSCAFTNAVRMAYREAGAASDPKPFRTYSTVTKKWYDVSCDASSLVRCQSADGAAVVFLGP